MQPGRIGCLAWCKAGGGLLGFLVAIRVRRRTLERPRTIDTLRSDMVLLGQTRGAIMRDVMGTFRVDVELENPTRPGQRRTLKAVLVDTGAELSWVPAEVLESLAIERYNRWRFRQADGTILERWTGA